MEWLSRKLRPITVVGLALQGCHITVLPATCIHLHLPAWSILFISMLVLVVTAVRSVRSSVDRQECLRSVHQN